MLEVVYGHLAEVMLSQPATKIFLRTTEPTAALRVSKAIGQVEIERMKETPFGVLDHYPFQDLFRFWLFSLNQ